MLEVASYIDDGNLLLLDGIFGSVDFNLFC